MHAAQLGNMIAALRTRAGDHWQSIDKHHYRVGPHRQDLIVYQDGRLQSKSPYGAAVLAEIHLSVQCPKLRNRQFTYCSLQTGRKVTFDIADVEFLRPFDPMFEGLPFTLTPENDKRLLKGLVTRGRKKGELILTPEARDAIRLLTAHLEAAARLSR